jgi:hypothetical protein
VRRPSGGWDVRRRVVAIALAAALVLAPATIASAASLPGQAMYPFKLAIEQVRLASVQWSPGREAGERTRVADERLEEVQSLFRLRMYTQLPGALKAFKRAYVAAQVAVNHAYQEGELASNVAAKLTGVRADGRQVVEQVRAASGSFDLPPATRKEVQAAAEQSLNVLPPPARDTVTTGGTPTPPTAAPATTDPPPAAPLTTVAPPPSTAAPQTTVATTQTTTTETPTTTETTTTTEAADPDTPAQGRDNGNPAGTDGQNPAGDAVPENAPPAAAP